MTFTTIAEAREYGKAHPEEANWLKAKGDNYIQLLYVTDDRTEFPKLGEQARFFHEAAKYALGNNPAAEAAEQAKQEERK